MSSKEWKFRIRDILESIEKIENYVKGMTLTKFKKNELVQDAVVRNLEIIGEASKNVPLSVRRTYKKIPWHQISGMRNILIHEYFGVDSNIVWHTVKKHLPSLKTQLEELLQKE